MTATNKVKCWGLNDAGQLGLGHLTTIGATQSPPAVLEVSLPGPAIMVKAGDKHACAMLENKSLVCWGSGTSGKLGYGNQISLGDDETLENLALIPGLNQEGISYDEQDRLIAFGAKNYTYNANGDLTSVTDTESSVVKNFVYDVFGNLKQVVLPSKTINYKVDAHNRRVVKLEGTNPVQYYIWNTSNQLVGIADTNGQLTAQFVYGSKWYSPDYMIKNNINYQIVSNHLGSPVFVVNSSTGEVEQEITYDEFGKILSDTQPEFTPFGFAGCLYENETELCRFGARDYDASIGRWLSKDPILFAGGDTNLYGYVMQDPINGIDPNGLETVLVTTYDWGFGSHSALVIQNPGQASFLYDPAGSYKGPMSLNSFVNYHQSTGSQVSLTRLNTTPGQESQIMQNAANQPSAGAGFCAFGVSGALGGACGIPGSGFPGSLENQARNSSCK